MFSEMPSASSLFATYASMTASVVLVRSMANELVPHPVKNYVISTVRQLFKARSNELTLVIEETNGINQNQIYDAAEIYLSTKINPNTERVKISKTPKEKNFTLRLEKNEKVFDSFQGVEIMWRFLHGEPEKNGPHDPYQRMEKRSFELTFHKKHRDFVMVSYVPYVLEEARILREKQRVLKMFTLNTSQLYGGGYVKWDSVNLEHPATFETLAMESELKNFVIEDLNRFVRRKDFYKRVGRAWKRGYLLYGPPGTGKSSLVAAMANYLKFDVYDLQLGNLMRDSDLRRLLLTTGNRSILVIEDIDCSVDLPERPQVESDESDGQEQSPAKRKARAATWKEKAQAGGSNGHFMLTLSGLLNFIDGLWSSCGDERIIVFTTNHKERLDPALLRPGRMDMHIHMSYCTPDGFKLLATNYLGISGEHKLYGEIEGLIETTPITPAQVAEELMKSEDPDVALEGLMKILKRKQLEGDKAEDDEVANEGGTRRSKRQKMENKCKKTTAKNNKRRKTGRRKS